MAEALQLEAWLDHQAERGLPVDAIVGDELGLMPAPDHTREERDPLDRYYTPDKLADRIAVVAAEFAPGARTFLEPSCGGSTFVRAMHLAWKLDPSERFSLPADSGGEMPWLTTGKEAWNIAAVDLDPGSHELATQHSADFWRGNFLDYARFGHKRFDVILGNPPFASPPPPGRKRGTPIAAKHVERMLELLAPGGVCAVLIRQSFLGTQERAELFERYVPKLVHMLVERPSFTLDSATDQHEYAVIYWERETKLRFSKRGSTRLEWLKWK